MQINETDGFTEGEEPLTFHYSRAHRLKSAPQSVRDYYDGKMNVKRGLLKSLVATKANRYMLFSIGVCVAALFFLSKFAPDSKISSVDGTKTELSVFSFDDKIYAKLSLSAEDKISEKDDVNANFRALDADKNEISSAEISGFYDGKELSLRTQFDDYDIIFVETEVEIYGKTVQLSAKVKKN